MIHKNGKRFHPVNFQYQIPYIAIKNGKNTKNRNKSFIKKECNNEELTNEWKIIMTSKYPSDCNYIINEPENNLEF